MQFEIRLRNANKAFEYMYQKITFFKAAHKKNQDQVT